jgi:DNA polymerase-3 subunit gamma/tau
MEMAVEDPAIVEIAPVPVAEIPIELANEPLPTRTSPTIKENTPTHVSPVSALSIASIRAKKEIQEQNNISTKEEVVLPTEPFNETDLMLFWTKYAQKLGEKGYKIMESLLLINDPIVHGTQVRFELPNEGSKLDFESEKNGLLSFLRSHLHNHDITIEVIVNEAVENKFAFTPQDKYNRLNELNPALDVLRKSFELDI